MLSSEMSAAIAIAIPSIGREIFASRSARSARRTRMRGKTFDNARSSKHASAGTIVSQFRKERLPLENDHDLEGDDHNSGDVAADARPEDKPRRHQFGEVIEERAELATRPAEENETSG